MPAKKRTQARPADRAPKEAKKARGAKDPKELSLNQRLIKALAHPLRVKLLAYLNDREWSPNELSEELNEGLSQVSYHIKVLKDLEMIEMTRTEPRRGAVEHYYRAIERAYIPRWMAKLLPRSGNEIVGSDILEAIEEDLVASVDSGKFYEREDTHASYTPVTLDSIGCEEADEVAIRAIKEILEIQGKAANRRAKGKGDGAYIPVSAAFLIFGSVLAEERRKPAQRDGKKKTR
ncbi:MAG TPA: helix-turn-helix domain-containing protein [Solirubrobacterales bacterium]|nr:helix-turn-helix domain-containing protein [Solirubrobacterales bacterium]